MSLANCYIINPFDLCDFPQKPPVKPAARRTFRIVKNIGTHRKRKTRMETQGRANRRAWREYLRGEEPRSIFSGDFAHLGALFTAQIEAKAFGGRQCSLYDLITSAKL